ncbi:hypothetical protein C2845_PM09G07290 [Panicum miliaceum]|uniref:Uncharacterized protein n=1 Tax=Panicum miliaceum TaxID=4540 RepID=A0A3L6S2R2_PANMI|nr:hypothetical protein C2845_PM09G07290 [Panicum miliaceum]
MVPLAPPYRYLIVIDGIWKTSVWKTIQYALADNECGRIEISTTRNLDVAKKIGGVYQLQPLSLADSRKLFNPRIFGTEEKCLSNNLAEISTEILQKCGGVPLAIITIAKDYEIRIEELIWKWMGEGFILKEQGRPFYEVGEDYINELINRSMIQPSRINHDSKKVVVCRVHDMILDLITCMANEDGFLATTHDQELRCQQERIHRLCLQTSNEEDVKQLSAANLCHVRSLIADECPKAFNCLPPLSTFPVLRVLCLSGYEQVDNRCFKEICNLIHLRYLGLRKTGITEIPKEIQKLQLLQVLDIRGTGRHVLPSTFVLLRKLVCLCTNILDRVPPGFGNLKLLQQ